MAQTIEHRASVVVDAPVHQVYSLFSHFNDFPKFMSFVKEVTYHDQNHSHWVADVAGQHEWDAVNEDWIPDRQIGWHSFAGLNNYGRVIFTPISASQTQVDVSINYQPPAGVLGAVGERLGAGKRFEEALQEDLNHFAKMVKQTPANALDSQSSHYLFHSDSAAAQGKTTERQNATMNAETFSAESAPGQPWASTSSRGEMYPPQGTSTQPGGASLSPGGASTSGVSSQEFIPSTGSGATAREAQSMSEDTRREYPVLDQDIIEEPSKRVSPTTGQQTPGYAGSRNPTSQSAVPGEHEPQFPPEQIPPQYRPEGDQPQR